MVIDPSEPEPGMNDTAHTDEPGVTVGESVHGAPVKAPIGSAHVTVPAGKFGTGLDGDSETVAEHAVGVPTGNVAGMHTTVVIVGMTTLINTVLETPDS